MHCSRCGRPACPECLTEASVGFHCRACVAEGQAHQRPARTVTGARLGDRPVVTFSLIGINVVIFLITALQAQSGVDMRGSDLFWHGVLSPQLVASGEWWRLASSGFLHLSVVHIGLNMLSLYFLGVGLERMLGRWRFLAVYLLSMLGGAAAVMLLVDPASSAAGASGAIFGLMGGLVVVFKRFRYDMRQLVFVLAINLYLSFQLTGISWQDHIGGLVIGAAVTAAMVYPRPAVRRKVEMGAGIAVLVLVVAVVVFRDSQISTRCVEIAGDYYCRG
jgi:membrane associated rhomboid family serine protease